MVLFRVAVEREVRAEHRRARSGPQKEKKFSTVRGWNSDRKPRAYANVNRMVRAYFSNRAFPSKATKSTQATQATQADDTTSLI